MHLDPRPEKTPDLTPDPAPKPAPDHAAALTRERSAEVRLDLADGPTRVRVHRYAAARRPEAGGLPGGGARRRRLLMVHGFRGDHHGMLRLVGHLDDVDVVVPDLPGFGASPPLPGSHTVEAYAEVLEAVAAAEGFDAGDVVLGHSFGSVVVAHHAAQHRRRWSGVVLVGPISDELFAGPLLPGALATEAYYRLAASLPERAGVAVLRSRLALAVTDRAMITSRDPTVCDYIRDQHRRHFGGFADRRTVLEAYRASSRHTVTEVADRITDPVLLITGVRDPMTTPVGLGRLRGRLPQARTETLRGVGHLIHYEAPGAAAAAVRRFLADGARRLASRRTDTDLRPSS
ncbi:MAG: alpha/beta hydrolase [Nesterenkonia sp.]|uniref:alpha/beta fold hydrolase n=1 Tax=Nesterenkonia marinintestina TaxID=2979865 RepID=UPI0021C12C03|nr:alpha/beta hydrolase [Nesterenkonia sp. GX14115]MDO5493609.1 alpha/beta hydrolase [Nesterenkonia sp.]